jgi:hypothetical protein
MLQALGALGCARNLSSVREFPGSAVMFHEADGARPAQKFRAQTMWDPQSRDCTCGSRPHSIDYIHDTIA